LISILIEAGRPAEVPGVLREVLEYEDQRMAPDDRAIGWLLHEVGQSLLQADTPDAWDVAEPILEQSLEVNRRAYTGNDQKVVAALDNLGIGRIRRGRLADALPVLLESLQMEKRLNPSDNEDLVSVMNNLGHVYDELGRPADAEPLHRDALAMSLRV